MVINLGVEVVSAIMVADVQDDATETKAEPCVFMIVRKAAAEIA